MIFLLSSLLACGDEAADTSAVDTLGPNPIVPEAYELLWDLDAASCEEPGAIAYFTFEGSIDARGRLTGEETWYWFHSGAGWEADCKDVFTIDAPEESIWGRNNPCTGCDREFHGALTLDDARRTCSYGYESLFDDDNRDRIEAEAYDLDVQLDTLTPGGNVNQQMLVFSYVQDDQTPTSYNGRAQARGTYTPATEGDYEGAATVSWTVQQGLCVSFGG
jgi:hypothetical protein